MGPTSGADQQQQPARTATAKPGPLSRVGVWLVAHPLSTALSLALLGLMLWLLPPIANWLFFNASWRASSAEACRAHSGACWAFVAEKVRLILFGTYPFEEQWRPAAASVLLVGLIVCSCVRRLWRPGLGVAWAGGLPTAAVLMWGGIAGLSPVEDMQWGGLPITLMLSVFGIVGAFPLGVLLALGRRSRMPVIRAMSVVYIELIRGVPLISLLFMASVMLPLFLPEGFSIDKLLRAQIAVILFAAAYIAETVRGGLQAIPKGQYEGAESIGLSYWQQMRGIILPQALKVVIPPLVSTFIALFKDTSLVAIIGIFDLSLTAKAALADPAWTGFAVEAYLFIAVIYFLFCYGISRYSQALEARLSAGRQH